MSSREPVHPEELLLLDYVIGQLPDETRDQIKRHVAGCRACRRTIDDLILTVDELDRLPTMAIPHDSPAELTAPRQRPRSRIRWFVPALALVLVALLAVVTFGGGGRGTSPPPTVQTFSVDVPPNDGGRLRELLPPEAQELVVTRENGDYAVLAPETLVPSIVRALSQLPRGTTSVSVVSTGDDDLRTPTAG